MQQSDRTLVTGYVDPSGLPAMCATLGSCTSPPTGIVRFCPIFGGSVWAAAAPAAGVLRGLRGFGAQVWDTG